MRKIIPISGSYGYFAVEFMERQIDLVYFYERDEIWRRTFTPRNGWAELSAFLEASDHIRKVREIL